MAGFKLDALNTLTPTDDPLFNKGGYMGTGSLAAIFNQMRDSPIAIVYGIYRNY